MANKQTTHNGLTCVFTEADHSYKIKETGGLLTSVTTVVKQFTPPFDGPVMAQQMIDKKKPAYIGMTIDEIKQMWFDNGQMAANEGTNLHLYLEQWPETKGYGFMPISYRVLKMTQQVDKMFPKLLERFRVVAAEQIVFSVKLGLAGQVDLIMADDKTGEGIIIDWKATKKITDEASAFGNLLPPVDHLKNADVVKYGLQLGIYEKILIDEGFYPEFKGYRKSLIHIREMAGKVVKVENYEKEIETILK